MGFLPKDLNFDVDSIKHSDAKNFCVSFPKSGRTWLRFILSNYLQNLLNQNFDKKLDVTDFTIFNSQLDTLVFTHDGAAPGAYNFENKLLTSQEMHNSKVFFESKNVLFLVRDPRDVLVSFYYHLTERKPIFSGSIDEFFFDDFYGLPKVVNFMNCWINSQNTPMSFKLVRYEEMREKDSTVVADIVKFFGYELKQQLVDKACDESKFDRMKAMERGGSLQDGMRFGSGESGGENSFKVRKGKVGGYVDELSPETLVKVNEFLKTNLDPVFQYK